MLSNFTPSSIYYHAISPPQAKNLDITGKSVLITGGNVGIGKQTCLFMAEHGVQNVVICSRNEKTTNEVIKEMIEIAKKRGTSEFNYEFFKLDLGSQTEAKGVALKLANKGYKFDVMILNAGLLTGKIMKSPEGLEMMMAVNHFGHYSFVCTYLNSIDKKFWPERISVLASTGHLMAKEKMGADQYTYHGVIKSKTDSNTQYGQSKLANIFFTRALAEKLKNRVQVNCIHPGVVYSDLWREKPALDFFGKMFYS